MKKYFTDVSVIKKSIPLIAIVVIAAFGFAGKNIAYASLSVGDSYQGGIVAYILQSGDPGYDSTTQKGIIAATGDQSLSAQWSNVSSMPVGTTGTDLGTGLANTTAIISQSGEVESAAAICHSYNGGGYNDWYLPSRDELGKLYTSKNSIGSFSMGSYWSSSEITAGIAWAQNFSDGTLNGSNKIATFDVRCVRPFVAVTDISSAGVTGFTAPGTAGTPQSFGDIIPGSSEYTVTGLTWSPTDNPFVASTQYVATVTLTSAAGYEFPVGGIASPTADGGGTVSAGTTTGTGSGNTLTFTDTFPETAAISNLTLETATISGSVLTLTYNEPLDPNSIPDLGDFLGNFIVDVNSSPVALQNIAIADDTVVITLSNPVMMTDTVAISYTPDSSPLMSLSDDQADSISDQAVTTTPSAPFASDDFSANSVSSSEIDLTWSAPYDGGSAITGYEIDRSQGGGLGGGGATFSPIAYPLAGDTSFSDTGLLPGTQYNYELIAINAIGPGTAASYADVDTDAVFSGGDGSPDDPFQITTCTQFEELNNAQPIGAHFLLEKDLDCRGEGNAITISTLPYFMGRVDGGGHRITIATTDGEGLFYATGNLFTLENLWVAGTITGATGITGSVVDRIFGGSISHVKSTVTITGSGDIGGIAGEMALPAATIQNVYFVGTINASGATDEIGGIVGRAIRGQYIKNSYSAGTITETGSNAAIGGIWGFSVSSFAGYPSDDFSVAAMSATGTNEKIGGLFGYVGEEYSGYEDNFWDVTATGQSSCSASGVTAPYGCNPENADGNSPDFFKTTSPGGPFAAWDFGSTWKTVTGGYPELAGLGVDPAVTSVTPPDGSTGVSPSASLVVNFSEPMDTSSLILASSPCSDDGCLSYNNVWSNNNQTVTLTPTTILSPNTLYTVEVYTVLSADEFAPASPFSWSFTTGTPPAIVSGGTVSGGCILPQVWNAQVSKCQVPVTSPLPGPVKQPSAVKSSGNKTVRTLKYGMKGDDVVLLQKYLNAHDDIVAKSGTGSPGHEISYFGLLTKMAVIKFQKARGLLPDGIAGSKTRALMI